MITFSRFEVTNFANYIDTTVTFAEGPDQPLTFLRGVNKSGKTTLFRAMTWCLYGMPAMPAVSGGTHPVRPDFADATDAVATVGAMCFTYEQDGQTAYYRLTRTTETVVDASGTVQIKSGGTQSTGVVLERRDDDNWDDAAGYYDAQNQLATLTRSFFREEYTKIVFADADEAVEFVGGKAGSNTTMMRERVTAIIKSLLSADLLDQIRETRNKHVVKSIKAELASQSDASKELKECQTRVAEAEIQVQTLETRLENEFRKAVELKERIAQDQAALSQMATSHTETADLRRQQIDHQREQERFERERRSLLAGATAELLADGLVQSVLGDIVGEAAACLGGLHDDGLLPRDEIGLISRVMQRGECICGRPLGHDEETHLRGLRERSLKSYGEQNVLEDLRRRLVQISAGSGAVDGTWVKDVVTRHAEVARLTRAANGEKERASALGKSIEEVQGGHSGYDTTVARIQSSSTSLGALLSGIEDAQVRLGQPYVYAGDSLGGKPVKVDRDASASEVFAKHGAFWAIRYLDGKTAIVHVRDEAGADGPATVAVRGLDEKKGLFSSLVGLRRRESSLRTKSATGSIQEAELQLAQALDHLLAAAKQELLDTNVPRISDAMNDIYADIVGGNAERVAIEKVGDQYEVRAYHPETGDLRSMGMLNGASRRALSTSFLLALIETAGTRVPFVSDSLLHAVDHDVRTRLINHVVHGYGQPIMFGIRADVSDAEHRAAVLDGAGATYTISGASFYPGTLVNEPTAATGSRSLLCRCGPDEFCDRCELVGDADGDSLARVAATPVN